MFIYQPVKSLNIANPQNPQVCADYIKRAVLHKNRPNPDFPPFPAIFDITAGAINFQRAEHFKPYNWTTNGAKIDRFSRL